MQSISTLEIKDSVVIGMPNGALFSLYICSEGSNLDVDLGDDATICSGGSLVLDPGLGGTASLEWQDGSSNPTFTVTETGEYWVTVDQGGCLLQDTIEVTVFDMGIELGNDTLICYGTSLVLDPGAGTAALEWQNGSSGPTFTVTGPGAYWVEAQENGCTMRDTIIVSQSVAGIDLGNDTTICMGETLILDPAIAGASFEWQNGDSDPTFPVTQAGEYWVIVAQGGCLSQDTIQVAVLNLEIELGNDTMICSGASLVLDPGLGAFTLEWQNGASDPTFTVTGPGQYWVEAQQSGCTARDTINVTQFNAVLDLGPDSAICEGSSLLLNGFNPIIETYEWNTGSDDPMITITSAGTYWLTVSSGSCEASDTIMVTTTPLPPTNFLDDLVLCAGETGMLQAPPGYQYEWNIGSGAGSIDVSLPGEYWVILTDNGCSSSDTATVEAITPPAIELGEPKTFCQDESLTLVPEISGTSPGFEWNTGATTQQITVQQPGEYILTATNSCGTATDSVRVAVIDCDCYLYLPNSFTPSGDKINDTFHPMYDCDITDYELRIYNRWGEELFSTTNPEEGWTGVYDDKPVPDGVYVYTVRYSSISLPDIRREFQGSVTVIR